MEEVDLQNAPEFFSVVVEQGVAAVDDVLVAREALGPGEFFYVVDVDDCVVDGVVGV